MSAGFGAGVGTITGLAAVGVDVAVVDAVGTIGALGSPGAARTGGPAGGTGATTRGAGARNSSITVCTGIAMTGIYVGTGI